MAWLTVIGPSVEQVDYRLEESAGCGMAHAHDGRDLVLMQGGEGPADATLDYRMREMRESLTWFGDGLASLGVDGLEAGKRLEGEEHKRWARALMDGMHPTRRVREGVHAGQLVQLVDPRRVAHRDAKLEAAPFLAAAYELAAQRGVEVTELPKSLWGRKRIARLIRMDSAPDRRAPKNGDGGLVVAEHRAPFNDLERLGNAIGVDLQEVYPAPAYERAMRARDWTVRVGERGYDLTLDIPKSPGVVWALADDTTAKQLHGLFRKAVMGTLGDVQEWASYGMRGQNGDGRTSERIATSGLLGWVMWHDVARPVDVAATPDPHLHAHCVIAHMALGEDGKWSTPGNGGMEAHRHVQAAGAMVQARFRHLTTEAGYRWEQTGTNGGWELAGVPGQAREVFSKRHKQTLARVVQDLENLDHLDHDRWGDTVPTQVGKRAAAMTRVAKQPPAPAASAAAEIVADGADLPGGSAVVPPGVVDVEQDWRASWRAQTVGAGLDPDAIVAAACPGDGGDGPAAPGPGPGPGGPGFPPIIPAPILPTPTPEQIAEAIFDPETGLTAHNKVAHRAKVLAAVVDQLPAGVTTLEEANAAVDAVLGLENGPAVLMPRQGPAYQTNRQRYTSRDIPVAEQRVITAGRDGLNANLAVIPVDAAEMAFEAFEAARGFGLSAEQRAVVWRLVTGGHAVDAVIGVAGAGKTTIMAAARTAWESQGLVVGGAATAAVAAANLTGEAGIPAATIASWLKRIDEGDGLAGVDVLVVDEGAMVDDRQLARLLIAARATGTKVVPIGDPMQLRAVGIGGAFAALHKQVSGLTLTENRRQTDDLERQALAQWRDGDRAGALHRWASGGRVIAGDDREDTLLMLLADWQTASAAVMGDAHDELAQVLVLAGTNAVADELNAAIRVLRRENGALTGPDTTFPLRGGATLSFAVGDHIRTRKNDYRSRRDDAPPGEVDILNGFRGVVVDIDPRRGVAVEFRWNGQDLGPMWLSPGYIYNGGLTHGTAMTVASAQGLTARNALVYGMGLDPHTLYAAMSRDQVRTLLYLPRTLLESDADRLVLGDPTTPAQELQRALAAYTRSFTTMEDGLVLEEWDAVPAPLTLVPAWTDREFGAWGVPALHRYADHLARLADLMEAQERAAQQAVVVAAAGQGPEAVRLTRHRDQLAHAAGLEDRITATIEAQRRASRHLDGLHAQVSELLDQSKRGRVALRLAGTSRAEVTDALAAAREQLAQARNRPGLHREITALQAEARQTFGATMPADPGTTYRGTGWAHGHAREAHTALIGQWDQRHAAAIATDIAAAPLSAQSHLHAITARTGDPTTPAAARARVQGVQAELRQRALLGDAHPERAAQEDNARAEYQAARATRAQARRGRERSSHDNEPYRPSQNPGHGRGFGR